MQVGVPGQGTGASEDAPHSPPKLGLPCDGRKKTAVAAVVRLEPRDANLDHVFCVTGALCRKRFYSSSGLLRFIFSASILKTKPHVVQDVPPGEAQSTSGSAVVYSRLTYCSARSLAPYCQRVADAESLRTFQVGGRESATSTPAATQFPADFPAKLQNPTLALPRKSKCATLVPR